MIYIDYEGMPVNEHNVNHKYSTGALWINSCCNCYTLGTGQASVMLNYDLEPDMCGNGQPLKWD